MDKTRKILLIIAFIIVVLGVFVLIYLFFFKAPISPPGGQEPGVVTPGGLPQVGLAGERAGETTPGRLEGIIRQGSELNQEPTAVAAGGLTNIQSVTGQTVFEPSLNSAGQVVYYDRNTNYFYRLTDRGPERLTDQAFYGATKVTWNQDASKAVIYYPDGSKVIYDFKSKKQYTVPKDFSELAFSRDGEQLAAKQLTQNPDQNWLVVFSPDGKIMKGVERLGDNGDRVDINWSPNSQVVAFLQESRGGSGAEIFPLGQNQENYAAFRAPGYGFEALWSADDSTFLFSSSKGEDSFRPRLYLGRGSSDYLGAAQTDLNLQTTVDKCAFNAGGTVAYCAVPQNLPPVSGPFPQLGEGLQHDFYRVDMATGQIKFVGQPFFTIEGSPSAVDVDRVFVSPNEDRLYFTNRLTGQVYQMRLR